MLCVFIFTSHIHCNEKVLKLFFIAYYQAHEVSIKLILSIKKNTCLPILN